MWTPDIFHREKSGEGDSSGLQRSPRTPIVGIALGAGVARGWSHIGVLRELAAQGLTPTIVAGASVGAVVGGCFAAGQLDELESFARGMTRRGILSLLDISFAGGGLFGGARLRAKLDECLPGMKFEDLPVRFSAVATEIGSGHEIWLNRGPLAKAIQASYAMPGIFEPVRIDGRWLFDGALVNPIPVSVCRVLGADIVIAVSLSANPQLRAPMVPELTPALPVEAAPVSGLASWRPRGFPRLRATASADDTAPGMAQLMSDAFNITTDRIARSRLAGDPPDVTIRVRTGDIGLFDFHRADALIEHGRQAAQRVVADIRDLIGQASEAPPTE